VAHVTSDSEPGERLVVTGRILRADGTTPASGVVLTLYQTDSVGIYGPGSGRPEEVARLKGKLVTGADGRYEIVTIRPGHYPGGGVPAHIHAAVDGVTIPDYLFAGDRYLKGGEGGFAMQVRRGADGVWRGSRDIVLR
jgi:protocatechuate 3,4-dioxygenase beta subunit